jgi:transposase
MKDVLWLTRVPETLAEAKRLVRETEKDTMQDLKQKATGARNSTSPTPGFRSAGWWSFSQAAYQRELHTSKKPRKKNWPSRKRMAQTLSAEFNCQADAETAAKQFNQRWKYHQAPARWNRSPNMPGLDAQPLKIQPGIVAYGLAGSISDLTKPGKSQNEPLGKFIIATNELDVAAYQRKQMLENYTDQGVSVERGFRFLKDPLFFADSLFLKKPERIMALIMIMTLALCSSMPWQNANCA